jgi:hypothetical protein
MKQKARVMALLILWSVTTLAPSNAQESKSKPVDQMMKEIAQLENLALDQSLPLEVREVNATILANRKAQARAAVKRRIEALKTYEASVQSILAPEEVSVVNHSIHEFESVLQQLDQSSANPALTSSAYAEIASTKMVPLSTQEPRPVAGEKVAYTSDLMDSREGRASAKPSSTKTAVAEDTRTAQPPANNGQKAGNADLEVDVARTQLSGEKIRGPATVRLTNVNILRYDVKVGQDITFPPGPDLKLPFIPPIPTQQAPANPAATKGLLSDYRAMSTDRAFRELSDYLDGLEREKFEEVTQKITAAIGATNSAKDQLESLVSSSDSTLSSPGGPQAILAAIPAVRTTIASALANSWPDVKIEEMLTEFDLLKNAFVTLRANADFADWYKTHKDVYEAKVARVGEVQNQLNGLKSTSPQGVAFKDAQNKLRLWDPILVGVVNGGVAGFTIETKARCSFSFDSNKEIKIKLVKRDRLAAAGATPTTEEIVTAVCSSPLTISGGFGFSTIEEKEFVLVQSTKTVTNNGQTSQMVINRFGLKNNSSFRTIPVLLLNTRFWEPNETLALHLSAGAAVDIKTGQGGTDLEFIVGPSLSFKRTLFVTPGLHIGRVPKLAGGFMLDQEAPTGVSTPPVEKAWKPGFATTFTFKLR